MTDYINFLSPHLKLKLILAARNLSVVQTVYDKIHSSHEEEFL